MNQRWSFHNCYKVEQNVTKYKSSAAQHGHFITLSMKYWNTVSVVSGPCWHKNGTTISFHAFNNYFAFFTNTFFQIIVCGMHAFFYIWGEVFGLPFTASQYCFGKVFPVWNFSAFYFMHANCPNGDGNQSSFGRFRYYYVNYRTCARR